MQARGVVVDPRLKARAVEVLDQVVEARRRAVDAVHEEHRDLLRLVRLEEIDAGPGALHEVERPPQPAFRVLLPEPGVGERDDITRDGKLAEGTFGLALERAL